MSFISLEMPMDAAADFQRDGLIGAGGPTPGKEHVFECLLSDLEWSGVEARLKVLELPFKVRLPGSTELRSFNRPTW